VEEFQKRMMASLGAMDPDAMAKAWMPDGMAGWEQWRNLWQPQSGDDEKKAGIRETCNISNAYGFWTK
jgi:hypothetical protein